MITVVIPLYNKEATIKRTIESVLAQSVRDWELIVVDDGSSDAGPEYVRRFGDTRIRLVTQPNSGASAARNKGVELATNDMVAFLDADDYWAEDHLFNLRRLIDVFPCSSLYATAYQVVGADGRVRKIRLREVENHEELICLENYFADVMDYENPVSSSAVAMNKNTLNEVGGFPLGVRSGEDLITWARLACKGSIAYSRHATSFYVLPPVDRATNRKAIRQPQKPDYVGQELSRLSNQCGHLAASVNRYLGGWYRIRAMLFMELNRRRESLIELSKAVRASGLCLRDIASLGLLIMPGGLRAMMLSNWRQLIGRIR